MYPSAKLTIRSSQWLRGGHEPHIESSNSCLFRPRDGRMCCLGIVAHDYFGVPAEAIQSISSPGVLLNHVLTGKMKGSDEISRYLHSFGSSEVEYSRERRTDIDWAMRVNDVHTWGELANDSQYRAFYPEWFTQRVELDHDKMISDEDRIELLRPVFERRGIELEFINDEEHDDRCAIGQREIAVAEESEDLPF